MKAVLKKAWAGFAAAITSSVAVKEEKNIAVLVVTGILVAVGASDGLVQIVVSVINGL